MTSGRYKMNDENSTEQIKKYTFYTNLQNSNSNSKEDLEILIPEVCDHVPYFSETFDILIFVNDINSTNLNSYIFQKEKSAGYSLYTWRCAPLLAWFLWDRRNALPNKRILEIGCGTALPGILAAKCGAHVTLSDSCTLPKTLKNVYNSCLLNNLQPGKDIDIIGLSWGVFLDNIFALGPIDYIIGSDCFYDPSVFEDILVTISFLLDRNPAAKFLFSYQVRSSDWSIEALLKKWNLIAVKVLSKVLKHVHKLFVRNVPFTIASRQLKEHFSAFGHISSASVVFDKNTGMTRGYGFVTFSSKEAYDKALNQKVHMLDGKVLKIEEASAA